MVIILPKHVTSWGYYTKKYVGRIGKSILIPSLSISWNIEKNVIQIVWWGQNMSIYIMKTTKQRTAKARSDRYGGNRLRIPRRSP